MATNTHKRKQEIIFNFTPMIEIPREEPGDGDHQIDPAFIMNSISNELLQRFSGHPDFLSTSSFYAIRTLPQLKIAVEISNGIRIDQPVNQVC